MKNKLYVEDKYSLSFVYKKIRALEDCYFMVGAIAVSDRRQDHAILEFVNDQTDVTKFIVGSFVENIDLLTEDWLAMQSFSRSKDDDVFITTPLLCNGKSADEIVNHFNELAVKRNYIIKDIQINDFLDL